MPPGWMARNAAIPLEVERRRHMENEGRIAILCWKWATATERGDFFCVSETITFIFPSNEISPEWERRRRTAQVVEEGGKHFVRRHVRGGSRSVGGGELERTDPERHHAHVRRARIDSFHLRVWSSSSSSEPRGERYFWARTCT